MRAEQPSAESALRAELGMFRYEGGETELRVVVTSETQPLLLLSADRRRSIRAVFDLKQSSAPPCPVSRIFSRSVPHYITGKVHRFMCASQI